MALPRRLRNIDNAHKEYRAFDPATPLTKCAIRRLVKEGVIPHIRVGRKILLNYDALLEYLSAEQSAQTIDTTTGTIRKIS